VHREIKTGRGTKKVGLRETPRAVRLSGGLSAFIEFFAENPLSPGGERALRGF